MSNKTMSNDKTMEIIIFSMVMAVVLTVGFYMYNSNVSAKEKETANGMVEPSTTQSPYSMEDSNAETEAGYEMLSKEQADIKGYEFVTGTIICSKTGDYILVTNTTDDTSIYNSQMPIRLVNGNKSPITLMREGDVVEIMCGAIEELWPAQTTVYGYRIVSHGTTEKIDPKVLIQLSEYGWID